MGLGGPISRPEQGGGGGGGGGERRWRKMDGIGPTLLKETFHPCWPLKCRVWKRKIIFWWTFLKFWKHFFHGALLGVVEATAQMKVQGMYNSFLHWCDYLFLFSLPKKRGKEKIFTRPDFMYNRFANLNSKLRELLRERERENWGSSLSYFFPISDIDA